MTTENGFAAARAWLEARDLPVPYLPPALAARMRVIDEQTFSTRASMPCPPIWMSAWVDEAREGKPEDYALLAFAGRGAAAHAVHLYVALGPLIALLQMPWGSGLGDPGMELAGIRWSLERLEPMLRYAEAHADAPRRWLLAMSGFDKSGWMRLPDGRWHDEQIMDSLAAKMGLKS